MKKERFLDLVCAGLSSLGATADEISKQRAYISRYLGSLGIGEESAELDNEDPKAFAKEIFSVIASRRVPVSAPPSNPNENKADVKTDEPTAETAGVKDGDTEAYEEDLSDDDVKVFSPENIDTFEELPPIEASAEEKNEKEHEYSPEGEALTDEKNGESESPSKSDSEQSPEDFYDELGDSLTEETEDYYDDGSEPEGATREYSISDLIADSGEETIYEPDDDDYYESDDRYVKPAGNPVFFWILTVLLCPVWIPLAGLMFLLIGIGYPLLIAFVAIYIPLLIVLILGGSVASIAELVYSIIKFVTGEIHIGLFELGLGFAVAALTLCLSVLVYRSGTRFAPRAIKKYWKSIKKLMKKLKRAIRRIKGVCSI